MPHTDLVIDGEKYPSATELTALLPKDFLWSWYKREVQKHGWNGWLKCLAASEAGKKLGTIVHAHLESLVTGLELSIGLDNSIEIAKKLYHEVRSRAEEYVSIEPHLVSASLKIHGTADIIYRQVGDLKLRVGDYKTSFIQDKISHPVQLAVYALCWNETHSEYITAGDIFRIDKKTLKVKIDTYENLDQYYSIVEALKRIWDHTHSNGR